MRNFGFILALLPLTAVASTIVGNPTTSVVLVDGSDVYVDHVATVECGTSAQDSFNVGATLDQWESAQLILDEVDYCSVVVHVRWTAAGSIVPVTVSGFDTLSVSASGGTVAIELDETAETAVLVD